MAKHPARAAAAVDTYLRKYLFAPRYAREHRLSIAAADGTRIAGARLDGPADAPATVVLVHGFLNWSRTPAVHAFAHHLAEHVHVIVPDLRGHGRSSGASTIGLDEPLDVAAAVAAADLPLPVVTVGVSLGGAAVVLHAGTHGGVAGTVAISAPAWWGGYDRHGSQRIHRYVNSRARRALLAALLRTRVAPARAKAPNPADAASDIAPAFTIVVHDPDDVYFGPEHAERLYAEAGEPKQLWWYPGAGHGTDLLTAELADRLLEQIRAVSASPSP